ncbi:MAG TPA: thioredoxin domain-containing protein [Rhizomicrobium sp.]|nr:thioredoxin domain-containing protein [Rhizomicrobium sp.]
MDRKQLLIGIVVMAVVALCVAAYFVFAGSSSGDTSIAASSGIMAVTVQKQDHTLGSPKAPLTIVEYAAPTCPHCAHFDMDIFPQFKQQFIDTGKVYFVFRVFPLSGVDVAAESIARCLPEDNYFQFLDLLYRNQPKWDPDGYQIPDVRTALEQMGKIVGLSADKVDSCIGDQAEAKQIEQVGQEAATNYGVLGTPTFVLDGQTHGPFVDFQELKSFLDPILAKKK